MDKQQEYNYTQQAMQQQAQTSALRQSLLAAPTTQPQNMGALAQPQQQQQLNDSQISSSQINLGAKLIQLGQTKEGVSLQKMGFAAQKNQIEAKKTQLEADKLELEQLGNIAGSVSDPETYQNAYAWIQRTNPTAISKYRISPEYTPQSANLMQQLGTAAMGKTKELDLQIKAYNAGTSIQELEESKQDQARATQESKSKTAINRENLPIREPHGKQAEKQSQQLSKELGSVEQELQRELGLISRNTKLSSKAPGDGTSAKLLSMITSTPLPAQESPKQVAIREAYANAEARRKSIIERYSSAGVPVPTAGSKSTTGISRADAKAQLKSSYPDATDSDLDAYLDSKGIE